MVCGLLERPRDRSSAFVRRSGWRKTLVSLSPNPDVLTRPSESKGGRNRNPRYIYHPSIKSSHPHLRPHIHQHHPRIAFAFDASWLTPETLHIRRQSLKNSIQQRPTQTEPKIQQPPQSSERRRNQMYLL